MRVALVGSTGVLGRRVIPRLQERGHRVQALVRRPEQAAALGRAGVVAFLGNILQADSLPPLVDGCEVVLHLATAVPRPGMAFDWSRNDRIRREGTAALLKACRQAGVPRYVQQSITLLYGENGRRIVDEDCEPRPFAEVQSAVEMESLVRETELQWCILRGGLMYGPGTGREEQWREQVLSGAWRMPGDGSDLLSLIQATDLARAVVLAAEAAPPRSLLNVVDDRPVTQRELFSYLAARLGVAAPAPGGERYLPSLACSNARLRKTLGWLPAFPTFLSGLEQM